MKITKFNICNVKFWMAINYSNYVDEITDKIDRTKLAKAAAEKFNKNFKNGPLDRSDHWIWDCAYQIANEYGRKDSIPFKWAQSTKQNFTRMVELVNTPDSNLGAEKLEGSSPSPSIQIIKD